MRRMVFVEPGRFEWEEVPAPALQGGGEAIVRPLVMGRCDLDVLYARGVMPMKAGEPIGHEIIGEIVELGRDAESRFSVGDRVIVSAQISCGACGRCRAGETGRCEAVPFAASYGMGREGGFGGAVAERVRVPFARSMLVPLPPGAELSPLVGLADMATDAWRAVGPQLARRPGAAVLVMGAAVPVIALFSAGLAVCLGASRVVYVDPDEDRRRIAAGYGAEAFRGLEEVGAAVFDVVVDASMDGELLLQAIRACGPSAELTSVAPPFASPELPLLECYAKGLSWRIGRPNCRFGHEPVLEAWSARGFRPERVGPRLFPFDAAPEAWLDPAPYVAVSAES